ncbi:hypothetical protein KAU51_04890, partial [Candidatus Parcubacteria bacterium]|nr:hypothetical protein [Candidatus Parcubacteria bacterium]
NELSIATEKMALEEDQLILNQEKSRIEVDALTESLENLKKTREKPVIIPKTETGEPPKEPAIIPALTDEQIEEAKDKLKYMANQYKKYLADVAQFGKEYVEEHNALLTEEGKSYAQFLSNMAADYEGNADLTRQITDDIYEYNKGLVAKRKEIEKELFDYLVEERGKAIQAEKDKFEAIIKNYEEGSDEYINAVDQHKKNELAINEEYDEKMAEAKLAIFKEGLEQQLGEEKEAYKIRLEMAKAELGEKIKANEKYFEFIEDELYKIAEIEKALAEDNREALDSYLAAYKTTEEKIVAIKEKTAKLLTYTDNKYEKDKLKSIEKILIAEIKANKAKQEIADNLAKYGEKLNNKELENYIRF